MNIFKKAIPTVAGALQGFHKAIADLKAVKDHHDAEAVKHDGIIDKAQDEYQEAMDRACDVWNKVTTKAQELKQEAENEARAAASAIARVESFLGL